MLLNLTFTDITIHKYCQWKFAIDIIFLYAQLAAPGHCTCYTVQLQIHMHCKAILQDKKKPLWVVCNQWQQLDYKVPSSPFPSGKRSSWDQTNILLLNVTVINDSIKKHIAESSGIDCDGI